MSPHHYIAVTYSQVWLNSMSSDDHDIGTRTTATTGTSPGQGHVTVLLPIVAPVVFLAP